MTHAALNRISTWPLGNTSENQRVGSTLPQVDEPHVKSRQNSSNNTPPDIHWTALEALTLFLGGWIFQKLDLCEGLSQKNQPRG